MNKVMDKPPSAPADLLAVLDRSGAIDIDALAKLAPVQRMLNNSLTVSNLDTGNHLLGTWIDWGQGPTGTPITSELRIPPGGQQRIENFQFMTIWFVQIRVDPPVRLTNNANFTCFYEVNKLLGGGLTQQMQFVNPGPGSTEVYGLNVGQRLVVVPVGMHQFLLKHDPAARCIRPA